MSLGTPFVMLEQYSGAEGDKLYFYQTGTATEQTVYQDPDFDTAHTQPITSDADGRFAAIYLDPTQAQDYRVLLTDSSDVTKWQYDNVRRFQENFRSESFTITWEGFSSDPVSTTATVYQFGRLINLIIPVGQGTSNALTFGLSGIPDRYAPNTSQYLHFPLAQDAGSYLSGGAVGRIDSDGSISFAPADAATRTIAAQRSQERRAFATPVLEISVAYNICCPTFLPAQQARQPGL